MRFGVLSLVSARGEERHAVGVPRRGLGREKVRAAIVLLLNRAVEHQQRVAFTVVYSTGEQLRLGGKGGYDPAAALEQIQLERQDPLAWLEDQLDTRRPARPALIDQVIIDVSPV